MKSSSSKQDFYMSLIALSPPTTNKKIWTDLTTWLIDYHEQIWDQQIEDNLETGKLDQWLDEIDREYKSDFRK